MKTKCLVLLYAIIGIALISSCAIQKRRYGSGYYIKASKSNAHKSVKIDHTDNTQIISYKQPNVSVSNNQSIDLVISSETATAAKLSQLADNSGCDIITLKTGEKIEAMVIDTKSVVVKYLKCNNLRGPNYILGKSEVASIEYANGTKENFESTPASTNDEQANGTSYVKPSPSINYISDVPKKTEPMGLVGLFLGITGLIISGIPLGSSAVALGIISLVKINNHPEKYKQKKGLAIFSIIIGIAAIIGGIWFLTLTL
jgi:hypothetical protein